MLKHRLYYSAKLLRTELYVLLCKADYIGTHQTWGDYVTNVIDYDYLAPARLRLQINKITM